MHTDSNQVIFACMNGFGNWFAGWIAGHSRNFQVLLFFEEFEKSKRSEISKIDDK